MENKEQGCTAHFNEISLNRTKKPIASQAMLSEKMSGEIVFGGRWEYGIGINRTLINDMIKLMDHGRLVKRIRLCKFRVGSNGADSLEEDLIVLALTYEAGIIFNGPTTLKLMIIRAHRSTKCNDRVMVPRKIMWYDIQKSSYRQRNDFNRGRNKNVIIDGAVLSDLGDICVRITTIIRIDKRSRGRRKNYITHIKKIGKRRDLAWRFALHPNRFRITIIKNARVRREVAVYAIESIVKLLDDTMINLTKHLNPRLNGRNRCGIFKMGDVP